MKVGFAGSGNMAAALAHGWSAADGGPGQMLFCDLDRPKAAALADELGGQAVESLSDLASACDLLVLAVKPGALEDAAAEASAAPAVLSILAATPLSKVEAAFPGVPAFRVMPNQPVAVRRGMLCLAVGESVPDELAAEVRSLLELLGHVAELDDGLFDAATAVMSSTPAYFALIAEAIAEAGAREGLDPELSAEMVAQTLSGTGHLLAERSPIDVRIAVASPGGATEAGLDALAGAAAAAAFVEAVEASLERMRSL